MEEGERDKCDMKKKKRSEDPKTNREEAQGHRVVHTYTLHTGKTDKNCRVQAQPTPQNTAGQQGLHRKTLSKTVKLKQKGGDQTINVTKYRKKRHCQHKTMCSHMQSLTANNQL